MLSLCPGPLVGEMVQHMKDKRDGKLSPQQKAFIYSAVYTQTTCKSSVNDFDEMTGMPSVEKAPPEVATFYTM